MNCEVVEKGNLLYALVSNPMRKRKYNKHFFDLFLNDEKFIYLFQL